jgi:hypothetical protein
VSGREEEMYERDEDDEYILPSSQLCRSQPISANLRAVPAVYYKSVSAVHQRSVQEEIKIEEAEESPKMKVQMVEAEIESDSEDEPMTEEENEKS